MFLIYHLITVIKHYCQCVRERDWMHEWLCVCVFFYVLWVCVAHLLSSSCCLLSKITTSLTVKFYFLFLFLCFVFHLFAFSPRSCHSNPANPASKMSSLLCWVVKKKIKKKMKSCCCYTKTHCAALPRHPPLPSITPSLPPTFALFRCFALLFLHPSFLPFLPSVHPYSLAWLCQALAGTQ